MALERKFVRERERERGGGVKLHLSSQLCRFRLIHDLPFVNSMDGGEWGIWGR